MGDGGLAGLSHAGLDLSAAELLVGTSAGVAVAAQLASGAQWRPCSSCNWWEV
ncbi:MAG TPA: hypothetical protein VIL68_06945 [Propionibacteriaceae bacterium]